MTGLRFFLTDPETGEKRELEVAEGATLTVGHGRTPRDHRGPGHQVRHTCGNLLDSAGYWMDHPNYKRSRGADWYCWDCDAWYGDMEL